MITEVKYDSTMQTTAQAPISAGDYSEILNFYGLKYVISDYYYQIGEITQVQGWILHLSVVATQAEGLIHLVTPMLNSENIPFKIVMDRETCSNTLNGFFGKAQIGKVMSIYPENEKTALNLAKKLVHLTKDFDGPKIPTDICLGNIVYTRYGGFNPVKLVNNNGQEENYIYGQNGELICDEYAIPFKLPEGVLWPFTELASPIPPPPKKIFKKIYKPLTILKSDVRGDVYKGIYLKNLFKVADCVIKQGNKNMSSDYIGRNIYHRLQWQMELHRDLADKIPMPKILDLFQEDEDTYLVMEYIKGPSLSDLRGMIDPDYNSWRHLTPRASLRLLNYLISIVEIIEVFHKNGYVHRDLAPGNFLIDKNEKIHLIDIELSYSYKEKKPEFPFQYGTSGFMSPEQQMVQEPTVKEDIYGLGGLMLITFTSLSPVKFITGYSDILTRNIQFFIDNEAMAQLIASCLEFDPDRRPSIQEIRECLIEHKAELQERLISKKSPQQIVLDTVMLKDTIAAAINGLVHYPIVSNNDFWYSRMGKNENFERRQNREYTRYAGLHEGMGGVIYMLARAKFTGFDISTCLNRYYKGWEYIQEKYFDHIEQNPAGLYDGGAGIALAFAEGIRAGLIDDNSITRNKILSAVKMPVKELNLSEGLAGQGIAILQCEEFMEETTAQLLLKQIADKLVATQEKDGSWLTEPVRSGKEGYKNISMASGIGGICWSLLCLGRRHNNIQALDAASKALKWIQRKTNDLKYLFQPREFKKIVGDNNSKGDERKGLVLTFIKAYEITQDPKYKRAAEEALLHYPAHLLKNDFTQESGMAAMGEIYLEAWKVFKNEEWRRRAEWIANVYLHTFVPNKSTSSGFWRMEEDDDPTADFMVGNSGIIHFLLRMAAPEKVGYRILE